MSTFESHHHKLIAPNALQALDSMRRRPSGSTDEDDTEKPSPVASGQVVSPSHLVADTPALLDHAWKAYKATESIDGTQMSISLERRSMEKSLLPETTWTTEPEEYDEADKLHATTDLAVRLGAKSGMDHRWQRKWTRNPWKASWLTLLTTAASILLLGVILHSFNTRQRDPKGCQMSMMIPAYVRLSDFDSEHTRFASKYSLYLYREQGIDEDSMVGDSKLRRLCQPRGVD